MARSSFFPGLKGTLFVLGGAACISFAPLFVYLDDTGPTAVAFYRQLWGGVALMIVALARGDRILPGPRLFLLMVFAAFFFSSDLACWHQAILYIGPGLATILANFQVFFLALIGALILKEGMGVRLLASIAMAFAGLWMLLEVDMSAIPRKMALGLILGFCTAGFYTGYILTLRQSQKLDDRLSAIANMALISFLGMAMSGTLALAQGQSLVVPSIESNLLLVLYGVGCQGIGWLLLSKGLPLLPASRAGLLMLLQPTLSFVWDVLFMDRPTGFAGYCGAMLALFAIALGVTDKGGKERKQRALGRSS